MHLNDCLTLALSTMALIASAWSVVVAKKAESRQTDNDFYERRRQVLFRLMETRILYDRVAGLLAELVQIRARIAGSPASSTLPPETGMDRHNREALDKLEVIIRNLRPDTPIRKLEDAAADVEKMWLKSTDEVQRLQSLVQQFTPSADSKRE